ncbi:MAG: tetratricopeptide repeat protein [Myxococcota bacterium]|nr:tetratricopeptide repeat protein [Myxococcota bacterium]
MAFLKNLFGGTFESNRSKGETLLKEGRFGEAKLAFEQALMRNKGVLKEDIAAVRDATRTCGVALAKQRIAQADAVAREGDVETALDILDDARDICSDPEIIGAIQTRRRDYESKDARQLASEGEEIDDEELIAIIAGTWTDAQAKEYASLPDTFREALLLAHDGEFEQAASLIETIANAMDLPIVPQYLWLELGRIYVSSKQDEKAIEALDRFLSAIGTGDESTDSRVVAHHLRAGAFVRQDRVDQAKEALIQATRLAPTNHKAFLSLGVFLRSQGELEGAVTALERAAELMGQMHPDFSVVRELGLTYLEMGRKDMAATHLKAVIEHQASRGEYNQFDPETAVALAKLHEEKGDLMLAADLFRHLAVGFDTKNHFFYNLESARLLARVGGDAALVDRYFMRAEELAESEEARAQVALVRAT